MLSLAIIMRKTYILARNNDLLFAITYVFRIFGDKLKRKKMKTSSYKWMLGIMLLGVLGCRNVGKQADSGKQVAPDDDGFVALFDGKTLDNGEGDSVYWRVENGCIVGEITPATIVNRNTFLIWKGGAPADFELKMDFRISDKGNSGINYRSERMDDHPYALRGYQSDIDGQKNYTGSNYEERKRTTLASHGQKVVVRTQENPDLQGSFEANIVDNAWKSVEVVSSLGEIDSLNAFIHDNDWNTSHIIARGNRLQHYVNGVLMSDVTDDDTINRALSGFIGVQVHVGPPMKVEYRNILLKTLK